MVGQAATLSLTSWAQFSAVEIQVAEAADATAETTLQGVEAEAQGRGQGTEDVEEGDGIGAAAGPLADDREEAGIDLCGDCSSCIANP